MQGNKVMRGNVIGKRVRNLDHALDVQRLGHILENPRKNGNGQLKI
jgi:hypothetical protein